LTVVGSFWLTFCVPRLERLWGTTGLEDTKLKWLIQTMRFFQQWGTLVLSGMVLLILLLEWRATFWSKWRRPVIVVGVMTINLGMMLVFLLTATASVIAADYVAARSTHLREKSEKTETGD